MILRPENRYIAIEQTTDIGLQAIFIAHVEEDTEFENLEWALEISQPANGNYWLLVTSLR